MQVESFDQIIGILEYKNPLDGCPKCFADPGTCDCPKEKTPDKKVYKNQKVEYTESELDHVMLQLEADERVTVDEQLVELEGLEELDC